MRSVPPGSAIATTSASTAEPLRASRRSSTSTIVGTIGGHRTCDGVGLRLPSGARFPHLDDEFFEVPGSLVERVLAFELGAQRDLEEFGGWQAALLQLVMEVIGQVHLKARRAPTN